jgi:hypothetical protein
LRAKTNFSYTKHQIIKIIEREAEDPPYEESILSNLDDNITSQLNFLPMMSISSELINAE